MFTYLTLSTELRLLQGASRLHRPSSARPSARVAPTHCWREASRPVQATLRLRYTPAKCAFRPDRGIMLLSNLGKGNVSESYALAYRNLCIFLAS